MKAFLTTCLTCLSLWSLLAAPAKAAEVNWQEIKDLTTYNLEEVQGNLVQALLFTDGQGQGLVVLTESAIIQELDEYGYEIQSKDIYAYGYRLVESKAHLIWRLTDFTRHCDLDGFDAAFIVEGLKLTDLDNNGIAEIWVPYILSCQGDPGPMTMKIIMYEGAQKYALRGQTRSWVTMDLREGGENNPDQAFISGPAEFLSFARDLWNEHMYK